MHIVDVGSYWIESDTHGNLTAKREFWNYPDTTWVPTGVMKSVSYRIACCMTPYFEVNGYLLFNMRGDAANNIFHAPKY